MISIGATVVIGDYSSSLSASQVQQPTTNIGSKIKLIGTPWFTTAKKTKPPKISKPPKGSGNILAFPARKLL